MNLDHLRYFVVTSETLHTGKAAKMLNVGQSTISQGIRKLEEQLGYELFEKLGKGIVLSAVGSKFSKKAKELLEHEAQIINEFRSTELPMDDHIRVAATHGLSNYLLAPAIGKLSKLHSKLVFEAYSLRSAQVLEGVAGKNFDAGLCFSPTQHPSITVLMKSKVELKLAVHSRHSLLGLKSGAIQKEISKFPNASPKAFAGIEVCENHPALLRLGIQENSSLIFDSYEVAAEYVKNSNAWCLMPAPLIKRLGLREVGLNDLKANAEVALIVPKGRSLPAEVEKYFRTALEGFIDS